MSRIVLVLAVPSLVVLALAVGCHGSAPQMTSEDFAEMLKKPEPPTQLAQWNRFVGTWNETGEMVSPTAEEMAAAMPDGVEPMPASFEGSSTFTWAMDGQFLKGEGWHAMPEGEQARFTQFIAWDAQKEKFRGWYFSDYGDFGEAWYEIDEDNPDTMIMKGTGTNPHGLHSKFKGTMTFVDDDHIEWTFTEYGSMGKMTMKGTNERAD